MNSRTSEPQSTDTKIYRMLLQFESTLPEHEVGKWLLHVRPHEEIVLDETGYKRQSHSSYGLLTGIGTCLRCGMRFEFAEQWGNYCVHPDSEQERLAKDFPTLTTAYKIEEMKGLIQQKANDLGKCWGDVVAIPERNECFAVAT
jgi:hypothetical protein